MKLLFKSKCERQGHDWFPAAQQSEFIPLIDVCLRPRCSERKYTPPWGECACYAKTKGSHLLEDHYEWDGHGLKIVPAHVGDLVCSGPV